MYLCVCCHKTAVGVEKWLARNSTAVAIIFGLLFLRGVFHDDSIPLLYFFVLRKSVRVPKMDVVARP